MTDRTNEERSGTARNLTTARSARLRWYHAYLLLAAFDLATISFSLYLNHQILGIYTRSVEVNQVWAERSRHYREIERLAARVNVPGNDVFASLDPEQEAERMELAVQEFEASLEMANAYVGADTSPEDARALSSGLAAIEASMVRMVEASRRIFPAIEAGEAAVAGQHMADMDRRYAEARTLLDDLQRWVHEAQDSNFQRQMAAAHDLGRYEYLVMGFIVMMVAAVALYGYQFGHRMDGLRRERERVLSDLQRAEAEMRETNDRLETIVAERTEGLQAALDKQSELTRRNAEAYEVIRETQAQLVRRERLAAVGEVAALVAHGIRNPLASISSAAETGLRDVGDGSPLAETLGDIVVETRRLEGRIRAVMDFAHPFESNASEGDLNAFLRTFREALKGRVPDSVGLRLELDERLPFVPFDPGHLTEALEVIAVNGLEAMGQKGTLTLASKLEASEGGSVKAAILTVTDTGPGIEQARLPRIFDLFYTSKPSGTGIGLAMAKKLVESQGGSLDAVRGENDEGTTFRIRLPLPRPAGAED